MENVRVAPTQPESVAGDKIANLRLMKDAVRQASGQDVEMLVFPELCITGCWFMTKLSRGNWRSWLSRFSAVLQRSSSWPGHKSMI